MLALHHRRSILRFLALALAVSYFASAFSSLRDTFPIARRAELQSSLSNRTPNSRYGQATTAVFLSQKTKPNSEVEKITTQKFATEVVDSDEDRKNRRSIAGITFLSGLAAVVVAAKTGVLRGPLDIATGNYGLYTDAMIFHDIGITFLTSILGTALVKLITLGYEKKVYDANVARKLSHTLSAPLFMLFFPLFSVADGARFFAGLVTLTNVVRLYIAGTGGDSSLANAVSRSGDKSEALGGPFIYVCLFQLFILAFWRSSMVGIIAMSTMAAGDGMADLVGRRWGRNNKWWFSDDKSIAGSAAFAIASSLTSFGLVQWMVATGCFQTALGPMDLAVRIIGISVACALVELLPIDIKDFDNYTVPLSAAVLTALLLPTTLI